MKPGDTQPQATLSNQAESTTTGLPRVTLQMGNVPVAATGVPVPDEVSWTAQEYITEDKSFIWYAGLAVFVIGGIVLDVLVLKSFFSVSALLLAIAVVLVMMSVRPPRSIQYHLSKEGLRVGERLYRLQEYKAFGVMHDGKGNTIFLTPVNRFTPGLSVYFPAQQGEQIVQVLSRYVPMQEVRMDIVDRIARLLRL